MSGTETRVHRRLEQLINAANDFLPDDVYLGYALVHVDVEDGGALDDAAVLAAERSIKANMRRELERRIAKGWAGADADLAAFPADAVTLADVDVVFELMHVPTRISVIRTYSLATLRNLLNDDTKTNEQKRQIVKNQLQSFYADLQARLA